MNTIYGKRIYSSEQCQTHDQNTHKLLQTLIDQNERIIGLLTQISDNTANTASNTHIISQDTADIVNINTSIDTYATNISNNTNLITASVEDIGQTNSDIASNTASNSKDVAKITGAVRFGPTAIAIANTVATPIFTAPVG